MIKKTKYQQFNILMCFKYILLLKITFKLLKFILFIQNVIKFQKQQKNLDPLRQNRKITMVNNENIEIAILPYYDVYPNNALTFL